MTLTSTQLIPLSCGIHHHLNQQCAGTISTAVALAMTGSDNACIQSSGDGPGGSWDVTCKCARIDRRRRRGRRRVNRSLRPNVSCKPRLRAAFICDTGMPSRKIPALVNGLRGVIYTEVERSSTKGDLHSGAYGGVAPNPLHTLAICIFAGLKDVEGHIHIPGASDPIRCARHQSKKKRSGTMILYT